MKKNDLKNAVMSLCLLLASTLVCNCGSGNKAEASAEEIKNEMPTELKDSTVLQQEEENALDKLSGVTDSSSAK